MLGLGASLSSSGTVLSSGFSTPADLNGIEHWFKHNTGITHNAGSPDFKVTQWDDQINSKHWLASVNNPLYDPTTGTIYASGGSKVMITTGGTGSDISLDGDFAVYVRIKFVAVNNLLDLFFKDTEQDDHFMRIQNSTTIRAKINSGNMEYTIPTLGTSAFYNIGIERIGTDVNVYVDGTVSSTGAITNSETWLIDTLKAGQQDYFSTMIIVKGSGLSTADRASLETYIANL